MSRRSGRRPVRTVVVGCGRMAQGYIRGLAVRTDSVVSVVCEPSQAAYATVAALYQAMERQPPPNEPDLARLLAHYQGQLDAAFIISPHAYHYEQTRLCLEAGLDVLLEKPMVVNAAEAEGLIAAQARSARLLVVAFPGSLSPQIRTAVELLRGQSLGEVLSITGSTWERWRAPNLGTWRQVPEIAGGGFFFDTGAHLLNTVADLAGEEFAEVCAWLDYRATPVEIVGVVIGRLRSGVLVTLHACGDTVSRARSEVQVFCTGGILRTGIWGERLEVQRPGADQPTTVAVDASLGVWQQFLAVRAGEIPNPCPPQVGLRMARLWDAIRTSAAQNGAPTVVSRLN